MHKESFLQVQGKFITSAIDGEYYTKKGLGRARIHWPMNDGSDLKVDLFTTHLITYKNDPIIDNPMQRYRQTLETLYHIQKTDADVKIFAGMFIAQAS